MADEDKIGADWTDEEQDLIVADYFAMLAAEQRGEPYVKAAHRRALMSQIGRTKRSVEFKHMNISAVLRELGLDEIEGYKPMPHVQTSIVKAIDRYLSSNPRALDYQPAPAPPSFAEAPTLFIEHPPAVVVPSKPREVTLDRLVRKFDPVARDFRNRKLGKAGEEAVLRHEHQKLISHDQPDLARKVRWVAEEDGDGAGYDILSFDPTGAERLIEVKTTCGADVTPFYLTRNEVSLADERPDAFRLYRLYRFAREPRMFELAPPLREAVRLEAETYRAGFGQEASR